MTFVAQPGGAEPGGGQWPTALAVLGLVFAVPGMIDDLGGFRAATLFVALCLLAAAAVVRATRLRRAGRLDVPFAVLCGATAACALLAGLTVTAGGDDPAASAPGPAVTSEPGPIVTSGPDTTETSAPGPSTTSGPGAGVTSGPATADPATTSPEPPATPPPPRAPAIHTNGIATRDVGTTGGDSRFDADDWDTGYDDEWDLVTNTETLSGANGTRLAVLAPGSDLTFTGCDRELARASVSSVAFARLRVGSRLCLVTNESRVATLTVELLPDPDRDRFAFRFRGTVWVAGPS
jgi:hypothetical protein